MNSIEPIELAGGWWAKLAKDIEGVLILYRPEEGKGPCVARLDSVHPNLPILVQGPMVREPDTPTRRWDGEEVHDYHATLLSQGEAGDGS